MSSRQIVDLRKKKVGTLMRTLAFREKPARKTLRTRRRRAKALALFFIFALCVGTAYALSYASYLPQFSNQRIQIEGTKDIRPALVRIYVESVVSNGMYPFFSRSNMFRYPREEIAYKLKEFFPRIEEVHVSRDSLFATAVRVVVEEREAYARWCRQAESSFTEEVVEECFSMDKTGFLFAPVGGVPTVFSSPYIFRGDLSGTSTPIGQTYLPGTFAGIVALLDRLGQAGLSPRSVIVDERDFSVALAEGFELRASFGTDVSSIMRNLELVLSSDTLAGKEDQIEYIDLRFGNRVYYKLKGDIQKSTAP